MELTEVIHIIQPARDWVDYLSALLVPMVAVVGAVIAWQQWRINRARLKNELFDRRYEQFCVVRDFIGSIMTSGRSTTEEQRKYLVGTRGMGFLFDKKIVEYMDENIWKPAIDLECLESELQGVPVGKERTDNVHKQRDIKLKLHEELKNLEGRFEKYLQLRH